jgi:oxygen-independent coproporphyrinogen-3 oxidase
LIVEPVTAFGRQYQPGIRPLPSDTTAAQMYRLAQQVLTSAGYEHYEISNYAQPGYQCRHNRVYWANQSYYGFGMGAASYLQGQRFTRPRKTREYYQWVQAQAEALTSSTPAVDDVSPAETEILLDTLMLGLRMAEGLSVSELIKQFGEAIAQRVLTCLQPYYQQGWVEVTEANQQPLILNNWVLDQIPAEARIRLTDPEGFLFSNTVLAALFSELDP